MTLEFSNSNYLFVQKYRRTQKTPKTLQLHNAENTLRLHRKTILHFVLIRRTREISGFVWNTPKTGKFVYETSLFPKVKVLEEKEGPPPVEDSKAVFAVGVPYNWK